MNRARDHSATDLLRPIFVAAVFLLFAWYTWRRSGDLLIDFGADLYAAWQVSEGRTLYREVLCIFGPFSVYFNALLFRVFGPSLTTVLAANVTFVGIWTLSIYQYFKRLFGSSAAFYGSLLFLSLSGFSQYRGFHGNYNFITPYSHEALHGTFFATVMLMLLTAYFASPRVSVALAAGTCLGIVFLTKQEIFVASLGGALSGLAIHAAYLPGSLRKKCVGAGAFLSGACVPLTVFYLQFARVMSPREALRSVAGAWDFELSQAALDLLLYRELMGLSDPTGNLLRMILGFALIAAFVGLIAAEPFWQKRKILVLLLLPLATVFALLGQDYVFRALPLVVLALLGIEVARVLDRREGRSVSWRRVAKVQWLVFSLILMVRIFLNVHIWHYGFSLTLPAYLMVASVFLCSVPQFLNRRFGSSETFRLVSRWTVISFIVMGVAYSSAIYRLRTATVGSGGDTLLVYPAEIDGMTEVFRELTMWIDRNTTDRETVSVLPEGQLVNFVTRRRDSTFYAEFPILRIVAQGDDFLLAEFEAHPPDYVVKITRDMSYHGFREFGEDPRFGRSLMAWVRENYSLAASFESSPGVRFRPTEAVVYERER